MRAYRFLAVTIGSCLLMTAAACGSDGSDEAPPRQPGLSAEDQAKLPAPPAAVVEAPAPAPEKPAFVDLPSSLTPEKQEQGASAAQGNAAASSAKPALGTPEEKEKKRDLSAELQAALGQPTDCLDLQKVVDDGGKIKVRVGAYVGPSGRITRATVNAPGQPNQALTCIERRAVAIKMQDPIEDAPRMVEAELSFEIARNPAPARQAVPPPEPARAQGY